MSKQLYLPEYNYYQAVTGWRGDLHTYIKWRNTQAIAQMQSQESCA